jgi:transcriptional regulator with XRE-family HTH domain
MPNPHKYDNPLIYLKQEHGYSQAELAIFLGVDQTTVSNYINKWENIKESKRKKIFQTLGCSYDIYKKEGKFHFPDGIPSISEGQLINNPKLQVDAIEYGKLQGKLELALERLDKYDTEIKSALEKCAGSTAHEKNKDRVVHNHQS